MSELQIYDMPWPRTDHKYDKAWPGINQCLSFIDKRMESGLLSPEDLVLIQECLEMTKTRVEVLLSKIDKVETTDEKVWQKIQLFKTPIKDLELSVRSYQVLKTDKIDTIGQLVKLTERNLLRLPNLGRRSLNEIKEVLSTFDLTLGMDV